MTRNRLVLLAAALVLVLGVSIFVSSRLYSSLNHVGTTVPGYSGIDQVKVAELLARPVQIKLLAANQPCPEDGPFTNGMFGAGPVYSNGGGYTDIVTNWGIYRSTVIITPPGLPGPVVVRATNLNNGQPLVYLPPYGAGRIFGADTVDGKAVNQYVALALDTDHSPKATYDFGTPYVKWSFYAGWPNIPSEFCVGIQIDGPTFTEVFHNSVT